MDDISQRIAGLSPEKQKLLEALLKVKTARAQAPKPVTQNAARAPAFVAKPAAVSFEQEEGPVGRLSLEFSNSSDEVKANFKRFYNEVSSQLDATEFGQFSYFLNYGYVANDNPQFARIELPEQFINKNSVKLVLEVIGDCGLDGSHVLDVGCGRGGTVYIVKKFFEPASVTGIDLSPVAIAFCKTNHKYSGVNFYEGDAENLPFEDSSFDVVTNIESSHSYPRIHRFYSDVYRVLRPGGYFLYTDALSVMQMETSLGFLRHLGFKVERDRDITQNVLLSCDEVANTRVQAFASENDPRTVQNFLATPGSEVYDDMKAGQSTYRIFKLQKAERR